ncbi:MAG: SCO family protein [Methyloligellaceae bacterium]
MTARIKLLTVILSSFLIGSGAAYLMRAGGAAGPKTVSTGKALIGGPFTMVDHNGKSVTDRDFTGRFALVFFGFTHCPDVCPASLQVTSEAMGQLGPLADKVSPLFVSVDPVRDTPDVLKTYLANFDSRITGLTGSETQVQDIAKTYRVYVSKGEPDADGYYSVDHSTYMYFMGPNGKYVAHFPYGLEGAALADRMRSLLKRG